MAKITDRQKRFVEEYLIDLNATQAAIRSGYSARNAGKIGPELLGKTRVREYLIERREQLAKNTDITPEKVLQLWWDQANVDLNEIVEYRREACESCRENDSNTVSPNPDCPSCHGEGRGHLHIQDSRKLKGAARRLYNGVQIGKDGIKVLMLDRDKALENVARHLGMFIERKEITGKDGAPIQHQALPIDLSALTDEELAALEAIQLKLTVPKSGADQGRKG